MPRDLEFEFGIESIYHCRVAARAPVMCVPPPKRLFISIDSAGGGGGGVPEGRPTAAAAKIELSPGGIMTLAGRIADARLRAAAGSERNHLSSAF